MTRRRRPTNSETIYPGKVRDPMSWTAPPDIRRRLKKAMVAQRLSRSDLLCLLIDRHLDSLPDDLLWRVDVLRRSRLEKVQVPA